MTVISIARRQDTTLWNETIEYRGGLQAGPAVFADHQAIWQLLQQVLQRPSVKEFQSQLDQPGYEPGQRLLIKQDGRLVAHLRTIPRRLHYGGLILPVAYVTDLAVLPECCGRRCATMLLALAEHRILRNGAMLGCLRTRNPAFYRSQGWVELGAAPHWLAAPQAVLIQLRQRKSSATPFRPLFCRPQRRGLELHEYRCYEQDGLERLYAMHAQQAFGATRRRRRDWYWLLARRAFDRLYVVQEGSSRLDLEHIPASVVGYAVAARSRLIELITDTRRPDVAEVLLARFCADAMEQNQYQIRLDAPPDSPLGDYFPPAGHRFDGSQPDDSRTRDEPVFMVRSFGNRMLVRHLHGLLVRRLSQAGADLPCELGFCVEGQQQLLRITEADSDLIAEYPARGGMTCSNDDLLRLLLGSLDIGAAAAAHRIVPDSQATLETLQTLLPPVPLWFPPLDDLVRD
jgi:hypothetical protein